MEIQKKNADEALDSITSVNTKEEADDAIETLAAVKSVYDSNQKMRMEMTTITDGFKDQMMEYERDFNPDAKAKSKYNAKKQLVVDWQQREHDRIRQEQLELAKRKDLENLKVDLTASIKKALADNVVSTVKAADDYARTLFDKLTPEIFDEESEKFKKQKPKLKTETYEKCFVVPDSLMIQAKNLLQAGDFTEFCKALQQEETYDKWNTAIQEAVAPILNGWRARIPELKEECVKKSQASEEEKVKMANEKQERDEQEKLKTQQQLDLYNQQQQQQIEEQQQLDKMSNNFAEQAAGQNLGDLGKTKLVLKFVDMKRAPKAFMEIVLHCITNPKFQEQFPGFQKRDVKTKKLLFDEKGRPVYPEQIQWWISFFLDEVDGQVDGTVIEKDSKVTIRR